MPDPEREVEPVVAAPIVTRGAASIRGVLDELRQPEYLQLLGKSVGAGLAVGMIGRRIPQIALPAALLGGIYVGMELAAYLVDQARHDEIGPWIETKEVTDGNG